MIKIVRVRRPRASLAIVIAAAAALAACSSQGTSSSLSSSPAADSSQPQYGGVLTVATPLAPSSLDPILGGSGNDQYSLYPIFDRLVNFSSNLSPEPGLAKSWSYPNPTTLVMNLQSGVKFQDGTPFNAAAVKFNILRARDTKASTVASDLQDITSVDATSTYVVTIHLDKPDTALPLIFADRAGMMASPTAVEKEGQDFALEPVGAGPFKVSHYEPGTSLTLVKNADYWQSGKPYLDGVTFNYISSSETAQNALVDGQANFLTNVTVQSVASLESSGEQVSQVPALNFDGCYFNFTTAPFNNVLARQAALYALDGAAINEALYQGKGEVASGQLFPSSYWAYQKGLADPYPYDPAKAKHLLAEAKLPSLTIDVLDYNAPYQSQKLQIIQQELDAAGFNTTVTIQEVAAAVTNFYTKHEFSMFCSGFSGRPDASEVFNSLISPEAYYNAGGYAPPGTDAMITAGQQSVSTAERSAAYLPLDKAIENDALFAPLVFAPSINAYAPDVHGFTPNLYGKPDVSFLWISK
jgi:peptide/nickel transport system substrate-binding protein